LVGLTVVTGLVDAFSYLTLGHVFVANMTGNPVPAGYRYGLIVVLGAAMGIQNAGARRLGVPDLTTTVLTLTITGIAADSTVVGGSGSVVGRRIVAVAAMLLGALVGALLVIHVHIVAPLAIALLVLAIVTGASWAVGASDPPWARGGL
jgi:uncharacterized membrane protein YoaK (UPF0700 family)